MAGTTTGAIVAGSIKDADINANANIAKTKLATASLARFPIPLDRLRKWDAYDQLLTNAGATTYLGLVTGTIGSTPCQAQTGNLASAGATSRRARVLVPLPDNYVTQGSAQIRVVAGMKTTIASVAANAQVEAYLLADDGTTGNTSLVSTGNTNINSLTFAQYAFNIDATNLAAGKMLDVRVTLNVNDSNTSNAVVGAIQSVDLYADTQP